MKNIIKTVILLSCFVLIFAACSSDEKPIGKIESTGKLAQYFHTLQDLKNSSKLAVEVSVIETLENIVYEDVAFTISKAKILSSTKGILKPGDEIKILETGGTKNGVVYEFNGIPVMKPGENLYLFLDKYVGPITNDAYVPIGVYQGKFKIADDGQVVQQAPNEDKLNDYKPVAKDLFKEKLKQMN